MNNWKKIWYKKKRINNIILDCLINIRDWSLYSKEHFKKMDIKDSDSIFKISCGSGI